MSGPFSGPPSLSQERIHGVTAKTSLAYIIIIIETKLHSPIFGICNVTGKEY